ncbi:MAG: type 4a pilus biogenesis protein PilO [Candidatus Omnitrophica bacterium]|nr:type 4a pilus biogenesis protein PilO [Candidatus Omnitrophota bacterium]
MTIKSLYRKIHIVVFPALLIFAFGWFYNVEFKARLTAMDGIVDTIDKKRELIKLYGQKVELEAALKNLSKSFPESSDLNWLVTNINQIAKKEAMDIIAIRPLPVEEGDFYTRIQAALELEGSYHQAGRLVAAIESAAVFMQITGVKATPLYEKGVGSASRVIARTKNGETLIQWQMVITTIVPKI